MANSTFGSKDVERPLNAAFETNDLRRICRAVDAAVLRSGSIIEIARAAELDRVTLYRAFRLERRACVGQYDQGPSRAGV
jgi:DNA-binding phage protein